MRCFYSGSNSTLTNRRSSSSGSSDSASGGGYRTSIKGINRSSNVSGTVVMVVTLFVTGRVVTEVTTVVVVWMALVAIPVTVIVL